MYSIATLKKLLFASGDLKKVWDYFFDLMDREILLKDSRAIANPAECDLLTHVLAAVKTSASMQLGRQVSVSALMFSETVSESFYQGTYLIQGIPFPVPMFYFSDIETGSFVYHTEDGRDQMFRFSLTQMVDGKMPTRH